MAISDSDIESLSSAELLQLIEKASATHSGRRNRAMSNLAGARLALDELIGPDAPAQPTLTSLTEVQLFTDGQIQDNIVLANRLSFQATEKLARVLRDVLTLVR